MENQLKKNLRKKLKIIGDEKAFLPQKINNGKERKEKQKKRKRKRKRIVHIILKKKKKKKKKKT